ncbi:DUF2799 domain-containing protein [Cohaesibacter sp. CAU 1516]|uniref:DUF2799 domain-containing protein n=1 Tax=Cohaesibacter sp. CAU 1516 TaxID=2576038 RepID=UPI0010FEB073|nr:DUF2799 domain-containing protein [Cohaesibacter sp. CAU 1516]TLP47245.1 DUF2799 domain-containing protein [Cohaesibacter sp. CAU 1516]
MRPFIPVLLLSGLLVGCASLTEDECHIGNWQSIGLNDAVQGRTTARFNDHIKACQRYGVLPDKGLYDKGYHEGLVRYCTPSNGFNVGRNGYQYHGICPAGAEASFLRGYERGHDLHEIEKQIAEARNSLGDVRSKIASLRSHKAAPGKKDKVSERERRASLRRLFREADRLEDEIHRLNRQRDRALLAADDFLASVSPDI